MQIKECELLINITHMCNLRCRYCFVEKNYRAFGKTHDSSIMTPYTQDATFKFVENYGKYFDRIVLHFYGGEPFTHFEAMWRITEMALGSNSGIREKVAFSVTTNGTLIDREKADFLNHFGYSVLISCDGPAEIHDSMRLTNDGEPTFAKVMDTIALLKGHQGIKLGLSAVIHRLNRLNNAYNFLKSLYPDFIKAEYVRVNEDHPFNLQASEKEIYFQDVKQIADEVVLDLLEGCVPKDYRFNSRLLQLWRQIKRKEFCGAGSSILGVAANGDIYPCSLLIGIRDCLLGNVFENMRPEKVKAFKQWHAASGKKGCRQCKIKDYCGGGCAAMWKTVQRGFCEYIQNEVDLAHYIYKRVVDLKPESFALLVSRAFYEQLTAILGEENH